VSEMRKIRSEAELDSWGRWLVRSVRDAQDSLGSRAGFMGKVACKGEILRIPWEVELDSWGRWLVREND
jgi:hypothetical protein